MFFYKLQVQWILNQNAYGIIRFQQQKKNVEKQNRV